jgi:MoxR-like ATPase
MPSDVIGTPVFNPKDAKFDFRPGPVFGNIILIDEINRAPAKTQSSLFEAMEEKQVSVDGQTYSMELPFMVVATQNPVEQEGTYRLPEAQLDRFLFKINVPYPSLDEEVIILKSIQELKGALPVTQLNVVLRLEQIKELQQAVKNMIAEEKILQFIAKIVHATRNHRSLFLGASPRSSIGILNGAKAIAAIRGRDFITPDDVLFVVKPVLRHRIILTPEKEMEGITTDDVINEITSGIEVPR